MVLQEQRPPEIRAEVTQYVNGVPVTKVPANFADGYYREGGVMHQLDRLFAYYGGAGSNRAMDTRRK